VLCLIHRPSLGDLAQELAASQFCTIKSIFDALIDPVNDLQVSRQEVLEQTDLPLLKRFRQDGVAVVSWAEESCTN
jgi:hypothetical protein